MKTILVTTFAFAVMVFAFGADSVMAKGEEKSPIHPLDSICKKITGDKWALYNNSDDPSHGLCISFAEYDQGDVRKAFEALAGEIDGLRDPDQAGNERDVADSGNEDSTSAASASDQ